MDTPTTYVPISINALLSKDIAVKDLLGDPVRCYPVVAPEGAHYPFALYHEMEEDVQHTKDGPVSNGWELAVVIYAQAPGAYMTVRRLKRLVRRAIDYKTIDVLQDAVEDDTPQKMRLKYVGASEPEQADVQNQILLTALTFRGTII